MKDEHFDNSFAVIETVEYACGCLQAPTGAPDVCPAHDQPRTKGGRRKKPMTTLFEKFGTNQPTPKQLAEAVASTTCADSGVIRLADGLEIMCFEGNSLSPKLKHAVMEMARELGNVYVAREAGLLPDRNLSAERDRLDYLENNRRPLPFEAEPTHGKPAQTRNTYPLATDTL
jgi:hypothetical protein